jgi:hypothetical protein
VVFKLKQPPQGPRRRMTARAVAKELGLSTDTVMAAWPISMSTRNRQQSKLEEPVIRGSTKRWAATMSQRSRSQRLNGNGKAEVMKAPSW